MKQLFILPIIIVTLVGCKSENPLYSDQRRTLNSLDGTPILGSPSSKARFTPPEDSTITLANSSYTYTIPEGWQTVASTPFRILNFTLPQGGELYLSEVRGDLLKNANRWLTQFGTPTITLAQFQALPTVTLLGQQATLLTAQGDFNPGMGKPIQPKTALLGALLQTPTKIITIKLIASKAEATQQNNAFISFCNFLKNKKR